MSSVFCVRFLRFSTIASRLSLETKNNPHEQILHSSVNKMMPNSVVCLTPWKEMCPKKAYMFEYAMYMVG